MTTIAQPTNSASVASRSAPHSNPKRQRGTTAADLLAAAVRLSGSPDEAIYESCRNQGRTLITLDLDFASPIRWDGVIKNRHSVGHSVALETK